MITKEKLESWYEPKKLIVTCDCLTEKEELVAEDCEMCHGTGEVEEYNRDESGNFVWEGNKKCTCQTNEENHE